jgi:general secretion pathway protein L
VADTTWLGLQSARGRQLTANTLELFLPYRWPERQADIHWRLQAGEGSHGSATSLLDLPKELRWTRLVVWTPPPDTLLTQGKLPTRSARKIAQALPYVLEDQLLGDPEELRFAYERQHDGTLALAITARERLQVWLESLRAVGMQPVYMCPATLALPLDVDDWSAAFVDGWLWVRTGPYSGFACTASSTAPPGMLVAALAEARAKQVLPARLTVFNAPDDFDASGWESSLSVPAVRAANSLWEQPAAALPSLNLLQGELAPGRGLRMRLGPLLPAAVLLAVWLMGTSTSTLWEWWHLRQSQRLYTQAMVSLFHQTFPDIKAVLDPARQMQRNLETLQAQSGAVQRNDLLPLLASTAAALHTNQTLHVRSLKYAETKLTVDLQVPDFEALETAKNALNASGNVSATVLAANRQADGVEGRLQVEATAGGSIRP